jgi:signal transduction histidine kinase
MKVRTKFTALISLASLVAVVFFSINLYIEIKDEVYEIIDYELADAAEMIYAQLENGTDNGSPPKLEAPRYLLQNFWLRVFTASGKTLLKTKLSELTEIPVATDNNPYFAIRPVSHDDLKIPPSEREEVVGQNVTFRVRVFTRTVGNEQVIIHIAKQVLILNAEFQELLTELLWGILLTVMLIIVTAYMVAGRILHPLSVINRKITKIRESSLNERIPLGKSKDELYTLSSSLNSMFDRLEHSFARQREFIGNAAHEMKSPLTILMLGHEEMLASEPTKEIRQALEKQLYSMQRLNKLIRDLLSIARLEQQDTLKREPVDLSAEIITILDDYNEIIRDKKITVSTFFEPVTVSADVEKIHRLFINLIDNSIKYNKKLDGIIEIKTRQVSDEAIITITNSGQTIPPDDILHIFKQFYRVEKSRSQAYGGTGLGLTIALRIAEMHKGTLDVTSSDETTTFTLTLPVNEQI